MKIKIRNGVIYACEDGIEDKPIGAMFPDATEADERVIECGAEVLPAVEEFIQEVNTGSMKPRAATKRFEAILKMYAI